MNICTVTPSVTGKAASRLLNNVTLVFSILPTQTLFQISQHSVS